MLPNMENNDYLCDIADIISSTFHFEKLIFVLKQWNKFMRSFIERVIQTVYRECWNSPWNMLNEHGIRS